MPDPNPNQDFTDRLMGNPLFRAGAALTGDLPGMLAQERRLKQQGTQFQQTLDLHKQQFRLEAGKTAFDILTKLGKSGAKFSEEDAGELAKQFAPMIFGGLQASGDDKVSMFPPETQVNILKQIFTGGIKFADLQSSYPLIYPDQIQTALAKYRDDVKELGPEMKRISEQNVSEALAAVKTDLPKARKAFDARHPEFAGNKAVPFQTFLGFIQNEYSPALFKGLKRPESTAVLNQAISELMKDNDLLEAHGLLSPKLQTPAGRLGLQKQAQELEAVTATPIVPGGTTIQKQQPSPRPVEQIIQGTPLGGAGAGPGSVQLQKPGPGQAGLSVTQIPGAPQAGEPTRVQIADLRSSVAGLDDIHARASIGSASLFGLKNQAGAFVARGKEQLGTGESKKEYESFWADLEFQQAKSIRAMEKGNISKSDVDFFLAGFPKPSDPPTVGLIKTEASRDFMKLRLESIEAEFSRNPTADPKEVAARISSQLAGKRATAIRALQDIIQKGEVKTQSQAIQFLQAQGLSRSEATLSVLTIPTKKR